LICRKGSYIYQATTYYYNTAP